MLQQLDDFSEHLGIEIRDEPELISKPNSINQSGHLDEPTKMAYYLFNCAKKFLDPSNGNSLQVLPAMKCLYMALSTVLAPQIEVELRLMLGNVLLDHTNNFNDALEQIQKAHQLAESSLGAIKFEEKCRITRSLIDALIRTNSLQLAQNIVETISIEALQIQTPSAWNWFLHFSLMNLQLKLGENEMIHQALADTDGLLKIIQNHPCENEEWNELLTCSKVLILSFLMIILTADRKILSVFSIIPKASEELRQALNELSNIQNITENLIGTAFFGESLLLLNSLAFSNSSSIANGISNLLKLFERQQEIFPKISQLKLPGYLTFLHFDEFKIFGDFITLLTLRQSPGASFCQLQEQIQRIIGTLTKSQSNSVFRDNLLMTLNCFKSSLDLEAGIITNISISKASPIGDLDFNKKFREFLLSFTAHQIVGRLGVPKVVAFYDLKINSTSEVDLSNLMILNKALLTASSVPSVESLEKNSVTLQVLTNSVAFYLIRAIELKRTSAPSHHIRNVLNSAEDLLKSQMYHEPKLDCIYHLLQGEFQMETDITMGRSHLQTAYHVAKDQLANKVLINVAVRQLVKSFKLTGDDEISEQWNKLLILKTYKSLLKMFPNSQQQLPNPSAPSSSSSSGSTSLPSLILNARLHELVISGTGQNERLEPALEHGLNKIAEEFLDEIISAAADLASHRGSSVVDVKDILLPLERAYDLGVAGFVDSETRPKVTEARYRQMMFGTDAHQARKNQINSNQNKY